MSKKPKKKSKGPRQPKAVPADAAPSVSVVVVTERPGAWMRDTLPSIRTRTRVPFDPVVVDVSGHAPEDVAGTGGASVLALDEGIGFATAVNAGIRSTSSEHVVVMHDDVVPQVDWLESLLKTARTQSADVIGARLLNTDGTIQQAGLVLDPGSDTGFVPRLSGRPKNYFEALQRYSPPAVSFDLVLVARGAFDSLGGLDEEYLSAEFVGIDFCLRWIAEGGSVVYSPSCCATREGPWQRPLGTLPPRVLRQQLHDLDLFCEKWAERRLGERSASLRGLEAFCERWLREDVRVEAVAS